jgi:putative FmdB family regulatory protein
MPIFEYRCGHCDHQFEALVFGNRQPEACPACQSTALEKQLSTFATHVAGAAASRAAAGPCGSCGDPRGAGSCSLN